METNHNHHQSEGDETGQEEQALPATGAEQWLSPGVPIVRDNTPRPFSIDLPVFLQGEEQKQDRRSAKAAQTAQSVPSAAAPFPVRAPVAPPLPEEYEEGEDEAIDLVEATPLPLPGSQGGNDEVLSEFLWLFEYGLEMDSAVLNAPDRLDGYALLYGPAALKGYRLAFNALESPQGKPLATLVPDTERGALVWGVLYRLPARLAMQRGEEPSLLDKIHCAAPPDPLFEAVAVVARETYRKRDIVCTTYVATAAALQQFRLKHERKLQDEAADAAFVQRLLETARQRTLPEEYILQLARQVARTGQATHAAQTAGLTATQPAPHTVPDMSGQPTPPLRSVVEQNTEPLPIISGKTKPSPVVPVSQDNVNAYRSSGRMTAFAIYLALLLLAVLALAVLQGLGFASSVFTASFTLLGVPWFVLVYGLLGGCASGLITLGRRSGTDSMYLTAPPNFVLVAWLARPFIGSLLAVLAYLLVNSGLLTLSANGAHSSALFSLLAMLAGATEGWIFYRKG